jgi:hypothetical protein
VAAKASGKAESIFRPVMAVMVLRMRKLRVNPFRKKGDRLLP